ncbi:MAG: SDR family oxidoreductase [Chloroflexi bacterium]|nr:SDR family oxidoreductase [Chloroflexota bacterium]
MRLKDKVAVITGAGSGIGRGVCLRFAEEGASIVAADVNLKNAQETVAMVTAKGAKATAVACDVSKAADVRRMFAEALHAFGRFDVLVNNAGILSWSPIIEMKEEDWDRIQSVNLKGVFLCTQEAARYWVRGKRGGRIVNLGSVNSEFAALNNAHYAASKGGVKMFTRSAALEFAPYHINVNAVGPGGVQTNISPRLADPKTALEAGKEVPWGRIGQPRDIANVILFLASDDAEYVTGQLLIVDGGKTISV